MPQKVFVTDLKTVKRLRISCKQCGFALEMPIATLTSREYPFPGRCPGCEMPVSNSDQFQKDLSAFFGTVFNKENLRGFDVFLESEAGYIALR